MKIFACLKEVPDRDTRYELNASETGINETDVTFEISECDEYALEESLKLKEKYGGEVVILTLSQHGGEKLIRKSLAMGADRAILIKDENADISQPHATAGVLAEVLRQEEYDLILTGTQSDDLGYAQTGAILAELLGLPYATIVMEIVVDSENEKVMALREMESGWFQRVEMPTPALLTVQAGISKIRYATLKGIMQARKKEIRSINLADLEIDLEAIPQMEVVRLYSPDSDKKAEILQGEVKAVVKKLVKKLQGEAKVL